jgi:hypothetical protein
MKKQTAIERLIEQIFNEVDLKDSILKLAINEAKKLEREQIINAYDSGTFYLKGENYYKKTFEDESAI